MVKSFQKTGLLMLAILGMSIVIGTTALFHWTVLEPSKHGAATIHAAQADPDRGNRSSDRFADGTPDFLRLDSPGDRDSFRRWISLIPEYQGLRPSPELPAQLTNCAA